MSGVGQMLIFYVNYLFTEDVHSFHAYLQRQCAIQCLLRICNPTIDNVVNRIDTKVFVKV